MKEGTRIVCKAVFLAVLLACCLPWCTPPVALAAGLFIGLAGLNPWPQQSFSVSKILLKISVVGLGFGMTSATVFQTGRTTFLYTGIGITLAVTAGVLLGRFLSVPFNSAFLISAGTAICGASAIAAVCPIIDAREEETAVSFSTVFVLNSIGLLIFPLIGAAFQLSQTQFGLWAALAIHDTSSVVGAGMRYGPLALTIGATVKLVRSLWIIPLVIGSAFALRSRARIAWPWFILLFAVATWINGAFPEQRPLWQTISHAGRTGFTITLFLIGSGLRRSAIARIGWRPLAMGVMLWILIASVTLACIERGWIAI
jgi:uncharacterized integral membrane protein (TIGR00698 family)